MRQDQVTFSGFEVVSPNILADHRAHRLGISQRILIHCTFGISRRIHGSWVCSKNRLTLQHMEMEQRWELNFKLTVEYCHTNLQRLSKFHCGEMRSLLI